MSMRTFVFRNLTKNQSCSRLKLSNLHVILGSLNKAESALLLTAWKLRGYQSGRGGKERMRWIAQAISRVHSPSFLLSCNTLHEGESPAIGWGISPFLFYERRYIWHT
jgi:hypothetical protein